MKDQKAYHTRKLAIIEMIEECTDRIRKEKSFIRNFKGLTRVLSNSHKNIQKYESIRSYLLDRYNRQ
jgi:hypothetical protein